MGTHPIFESDFDCLTVQFVRVVSESAHSRPARMTNRERRASRKRSTSTELDLGLLATALKGRDRQVFVSAHPRLTGAVARIEYGGGFVEYENDEMEVDESEPKTIPDELRLQERLFLRKVDKIAAPVSFAKRKWAPFEEATDAICPLPPLEAYMSCSTTRMSHKFVQDLAVGDIMIGEIQAWRRNQFDLSYAALDAGQSRFLPTNFSFMCVAPQKNEECLEEGDLVGCMVTAVSNGRVFSAAGQQKLNSFDPLLGLSIKLGGVERKDLPGYHEKMTKMTDLNCMTDDLVAGDAFKNPSSTHFLLERLGVDQTQPLSLLNILSKPEEAECKEALRQQQSCQAAVKYVSKGVEQFKKGELQEAMNAYRTALELDASNVDALVARGALYCSRKQWIPACTDLEKAYGIDQNHKNAKKLLDPDFVSTCKGDFTRGKN